jgi:hypothetical protein
VIDQDPAHRLSGRFQIVASRRERTFAAELQKGLVYQGGCVERLPGLLRRQLRRRELAEFAINLRQEFREAGLKIPTFRGLRD